MKALAIVTALMLALVLAPRCANADEGAPVPRQFRVPVRVTFFVRTERTIGTLKDGQPTNTGMRTAGHAMLGVGFGLIPAGLLMAVIGRFSESNAGDRAADAGAIIVPVGAGIGLLLGIPLTVVGGRPLEASPPARSAAQVPRISLGVGSLSVSGSF